MVRPIVVIILLTLLASCSVNTPASLLKPGNLPLSEYTIDVTRDTILHTKRGAIINIPAGSIEAKGRTITLKLREAFSIADIAAGGLATTSNGQPLSSGGMIYINAGEQDGAKVVKPIGVSIPTNYLQEGMQLYKGEEKDGSINWIAPEAIRKDTMIDRLARGKTIFEANCASCHHLTKSSTGPALAGVTEKFDRYYLEHVIWNSTELIASGDPYFNCLYDAWGKTAMTAFPDLKGDDMDMLLEYLSNEGKKQDPARISSFKASYDSCMNYGKVSYELYKKRRELTDDNGQQAHVEWNDMPGNVTLEDPIVLPNPAFEQDIEEQEELVTSADNKAQYYQFDIQAFGWYNVDILTKEVPGYEQSTLLVQAASPSNDPLNIYLILPGEKIMASGGPSSGKDMYAFYEKDGGLMLPQHSQAYVIALTENEQGIFLGIKEFTTSANQTLSMTLEKVTKEEFDLRLRRLDFTDLSFKVDKAKNADSVIVIDRDLKALEHLKPKGLKCDCLFSEPSLHADTTAVN